MMYEDKRDIDVIPRYLYEDIDYKIQTLAHLFTMEPKTVIAVLEKLDLRLMVIFEAVLGDIMKIVETGWIDEAIQKQENNEDD